MLNQESWRRNTKWLRRSAFPLLVSVAVISLVNSGLDVVSRVPAGNSIAVLPFVAVGDNEDQYFADGLTEEIMTSVATFGVRVVSLDSVMPVKGSLDRARQIAEDLRVTHLLVGNLQRVGNEVRITTELIDARSDTKIWAERYERTLNGAFETQHSIAGIIARAIHEKLPAD